MDLAGADALLIPGAQYYLLTILWRIAFKLLERTFSARSLDISNHSSNRQSLFQEEAYDLRAIITRCTRYKYHSAILLFVIVIFYCVGVAVLQKYYLIHRIA